MRAKILFLIVGLLLIYPVAAEDLKIGNEILGEFSGAVTITGEDELRKLEFGSGGIATLDHNIKIGSQEKNIKINYKNLQATDKGEPTITVDAKGDVVEGSFKTGEEGEYYLGGRILDLPKGTEVLIVDGNVKIKYPEGEVLRDHQESDGNLGGLSFESADGKFNFGEDNIVEFTSGGLLKYENGRYYMDSGTARVNGHFEVTPNEEGDKTFFDFKGEIDLDFKGGGYVSVDKAKRKFVTGSNIDVRGPKVNFLEGNPYVRIRKGIPQYGSKDGKWVKVGDTFESFAVQSLGNAKGSYVSLVSRDDQGRIPKIDTLNQYVMDYDGESIFYHYGKDKILWKQQNGLIEGYEHGKASTPVEVHIRRDDGNGAEYVEFSDQYKQGAVLGVTDQVQWAYGYGPNYIRTAFSYGGEYSSLRKGFSNSWLYYNLKSASDLQRFLGNRIQINDQYGVFDNNPGNVKLIADTFSSLNEGTFSSVTSITFVGSLGGSTQAQGDGNGHITVAVAPGGGTPSGFNPNTIRHEIAHTYHYRGPNMKQFWDQWTRIGSRPPGFRSYGGPRNGFARGYGESNWEEDVATFVEEALNPPYWRNVLQTSDPHHQVYRRKLTLLRDFGFIKPSEYDAIFKHAGVTL